jgi:hypothetical protein
MWDAVFSASIDYQLPLLTERCLLPSLKDRILCVNSQLVRGWFACQMWLRIHRWRRRLWIVYFFSIFLIFIRNQLFFFGWVCLNNVHPTCNVIIKFLTLDVLVVESDYLLNSYADKRNCRIHNSCPPPTMRGLEFLFFCNSNIIIS